MKPTGLQIFTVGPAFGYGPRVYRVDAGAKPFLMEEGWELVHWGDLYFYLRAPVGVDGTCVIVERPVPDREEVLALAEDRHRLGCHWTGQIGPWPAEYAPRDWDQSYLLNQTAKPKPAFLLVGNVLIWYAAVTWYDGDSYAPHWEEDRTHVIEP